MERIHSLSRNGRRGVALRCRSAQGSRAPPLIALQLLLHHQQLGLELVALLEHVPQLLESEAWSVGICQVNHHFVRSQVYLQEKMLVTYPVSLVRMDSPPQKGKFCFVTPGSPVR